MTTTKNQMHLHLQEWAPIVYQPNQSEPMEFVQQMIEDHSKAPWLSMSGIIWDHVHNCIICNCILFAIRHQSFWPRFSRRSASFRLIESTSSLNRWKTTFWREGGRWLGQTHQELICQENIHGCILRVRLKQWIQNETEILKCPYLIICSRMRVGASG